MGQIKEYVIRATSKGQVTIPAEVRRLLGIQPGKEVIFRVEGGRVEILPPPMSLEEVYGSVSPLDRPEDFKKLRDTAMDEHSRKVLEEMTGEA